jgi:DNA-binding beta-propeller fold protein YncE
MSEHHCVHKTDATGQPCCPEVRILVAVHETNELVSIDPATARIVGRYPTSGAREPHGISLDVANRLAFVAGQANNVLVVVDLNTMKVLASHQVGEDPDVLAFDPGLKRLYVSAESGKVTVFREVGRDLCPKALFSSRTRTRFVLTRKPIWSTSRWRISTDGR